MRFEEAVDEWFGRQAPYWRSFRTVEQVRAFTAGWKAWWGGKEVRGVTVGDVGRHEKGLVQDGLSAATLNKQRTYLRMFFRWAVQRGYAKVDPTWEWRARAAGAKKVRHWLELEEEDRLIAALEPEVVQRYALFAGATGLRQGTIRALTHLHFTIHNGQWLLKLEADNVKEWRPNLVPLSVRAVRAVECIQENRWGDWLVFPDLPDGPNLDKAFARAARKAGLPETIRPHDLRRSFMRRARRAGLPLETVMKLTGSKSVATVLKHYHEIDPVEYAEIRRRLP